MSDGQLSGATGPLTKKGTPSAILPKELEGLETGGTYAFPESLSASETAHVACACRRGFLSQGLHCDRDVGPGVPRKHRERSVRSHWPARSTRYDPFVVRARAKNTPQLAFEDRQATTAFLAFETRPEAIEKSCWRVKYRFGGTSGIGATDPLVPIPKLSLRPMPTANAGLPGCPCAVGPMASSATVFPAKSQEPARPDRVPPHARMLHEGTQWRRPAGVLAAVGTSAFRS
jgi:hypothetical protein